MNKATDFLTMLDAVDSDIYRRFKTAIEIGRWPNGEKLNSEQKELVMQAVIVYENRHLPEHERTGYISKKSDACSPEHLNHTSEQDKNEDQPVRWK